MSDWLDKIGKALDQAERPVRLFFRDDDAGWADAHLLALLDVFAEARMPIDLAVIPAALEPALAEELLARRAQRPALLGLHQHGYSHTNHEPEHNRKCEFGESRNLAAQKADLANGKSKLDAMLGNANDPIFTPPWNRCTRDTIAFLQELGFAILSRDTSAKPEYSGDLKQAPVGINWSRIIKTCDQPEWEIANQLADSVSQNKLTGLMFHHADMDADHLGTLSALLNLLSAHDNVRNGLIKQHF